MHLELGPRMIGSASGLKIDISLGPWGRLDMRFAEANCLVGMFLMIHQALTSTHIITILLVQFIQ